MKKNDYLTVGQQGSAYGTSTHRPDGSGERSGSRERKPFAFPLPDSAPRVIPVR